MRARLYILVGLFVIAGSFIMAGDYTTPNGGSTYSLSQIATLSGSTHVSGGPTSFTLKGNLTVSPLDTLEIDAGESLLSEDSLEDPGYALIVKGKINVDGASGNQALLGSHVETPGLWRGILIMADGADASLIHYADIQYASVGISVRGTNAPTIEYNDFSGCKNASILVGPGFSAAIRHNTITAPNNAAGIVLDAAQGAEVLSNTVNGAAVGLVSAGSDAGTLVKLNTTGCVNAGMVSSGMDEAKLEDNDLLGGHLGGVASDGSSAFWYLNTIDSQETAGMGIVNASTAKFRYNTIRDCLGQGGVFIDDEAAPDLGTQDERGGNLFQDLAAWDLINYSPGDQYAIGNTWSFSPADDVIYDEEEDAGDADGNGVLSGTVIYALNATSGAWIFYE